MTTDVVAEVINQSQAELTAIVRQILGDDATPTGDLSTSDINRGHGTATAGIYRVAGRAKTSEGEAEWSAAVKALGTPATDSRGREVGDDYREVEVYRSGEFDEQHGGVRAAHCYAIQERDELLLLWLEDLSDAPRARPGNRSTTSPRRAIWASSTPTGRRTRCPTGIGCLTLAFAAHLPGTRKFRAGSSACL